jgi:hypothetical protein
MRDTSAPRASADHLAWPLIVSTRFRWFMVTVLAVGLSLMDGRSPAYAQATRTWVSGVGDDANPCSRTAPCKTFAGAISKTAAGGEIDALDPGGFGAITITKSITLDGGTGSGWASILTSGTNGIVINAGAQDVVVLRNLSVNGTGNGLTGVRILAGKAVHIENVVIFGFDGSGTIEAGRGISDRRPGGGRLYVTDTSILDNRTEGVGIDPAPGSLRIQVELDRALIQGNRNGISVTSGALINLRNSVVAGHSEFGVIVQATGTEVNIDDSEISTNASGVRLLNGSPLVRLGATVIMNNNVGVEVSSGGVQSFGNNRIAGNGSGNALPPGSLIPLQ